MLDWIDSYLDNRSGYMVIRSTESSTKMTTHRVPQGSVLGPLLYLVYMNEFLSVAEDKNCVNLSHRETGRLFVGECQDCGSLPILADDAHYLVSSNCRSRNQDKIEDCFVRICDFLNANSLQR